MSSNNNNSKGRADLTKQSGITITTTSPVPAMPAPVASVTIGPTIAPTLSETQLLSQTTQQQPFSVRNGSSRRGLVHSVSIIVEPAMANETNDDDNGFTTEQHPIPSVSSERRNTIAGPFVVLEDFGFGKSLLKYSLNQDRI